MARMLLVRHGESVWNAEGRWQGQADPELSDLGREQARHAARAVADFAAIWSSDLTRARQTAEILAAGVDLDVQLDRRLRERAAGEWTGLARPEIEQRYPGYLAERRSPPGFEDDASLRARTLAAVETIAGSLTDGDDALVVTHGGVIRTLARHLGVDEEPVPNLGGRWLDRSPTGVLALGPRALLIDPSEVAVTAPRQL